MAAANEEIFLRQVGGPDLQVASLVFRFLGKFFQLVDHHSSIWKPERQARTNFFIKNKDFQFSAELAMIAFLGFFQLVEIFIAGIGC